jgi:hypothetical protein
MRTLFLLLAAGFDGRDARKIRGELVGRESFDIHFEEADERAAEVRSLAAAAIHDHADARDLSAMRSDDVDRLLHPAAARDDVFGYDEPLVRRDLKAASQDQAARLFFRENVPFPERAADFLSDDDSTQSGRNYGVAFQVTQFVREPAANFRGGLGVLKEQGALEKLPAVQAGTQHEMAIKQRAGLAEQRKQVVAH